MVCSHHQHERDKTPLSCLQLCSHRQCDKTRQFCLVCIDSVNKPLRAAAVLRNKNYFASNLAQTVVSVVFQQLSRGTCNASAAVTSHRWTECMTSFTQIDCYSHMQQLQFHSNYRRQFSESAFKKMCTDMECCEIGLKNFTCTCVHVDITAHVIFLVIFLLCVLLIN